MTVWFHAPEFRYNATPSGCFIVRAYIATFQNTNNREPFKLCMLHNDWHGTFPIHCQVLESLASEFGMRNGLDLVETCSYGYIQRGVKWKRYQCCYSNWIGWFCLTCETQRWCQRPAICWNLTPERSYVGAQVDSMDIVAQLENEIMK